MPAYPFRGIGSTVRDIEALAAVVAVVPAALVLLVLADAEDRDLRAGRDPATALLESTW